MWGIHDVGLAHDLLRIDAGLDRERAHGFGAGDDDARALVVFVIGEREKQVRPVVFCEQSHPAMRSRSCANARSRSSGCASSCSKRSSAAMPG